MIATRTLAKALPFLAALVFLADTLIAQPAIAYEAKISSGLSNPIDIVNAGDGTNRLFVVQRGGVIKVYDGQSFNFISDFLTVTGISTQGEGGLLSMAFHPDYENNGYFFVYYTIAGPPFSLRIARYRVSTNNPNMADPTSREEVLTIPHPTYFNHNGGKILFGPDGYLYLATGDGGGGGDPDNNAQNGNSLLGKMLRIQVGTSGTYTIPADNPYVGNEDPIIRDEIWAMGLRNPFRWSFDRANGDMWIADVGQSAREEVNHRPAAATGGINYGWPCREGNIAYQGCQLPPSNFIEPIFTYGRSNATGGQSITGGFVYRGSEFPSLQGAYLFADYLSGNQWVTLPNGTDGWTTTQLSDDALPPAQKFPSNIVAFGEAEDGTLYAVSISGNAIYKIIDPTALPVQFGELSARLKGETLTVKWTSESETNNSHFEIEGSVDGNHFTLLGKINSQAADGNSNQPIGYEVQVNKNTWSLLLSLAAILALGFSALAGKRKLIIPGIVLLAFAVTYACNKKEPVPDSDGSKLIVRIAQVDKDGRKAYSKTINVVRE